MVIRLGHAYACDSGQTIQLTANRQGFHRVSVRLVSPFSQDERAEENLAVNHDAAAWVGGPVLQGGWKRREKF